VRFRRPLPLLACALIAGSLGDARSGPAADWLTGEALCGEQLCFWPVLGAHAGVPLKLSASVVLVGGRRRLSDQLPIFSQVAGPTLGGTVGLGGASVEAGYGVFVNRVIASVEGRLSLLRTGGAPWVAAGRQTYAGVVLAGTVYLIHGSLGGYCPTDDPLAASRWIWQLTGGLRF
jgi:hypothetical protein